jgi:hypothetical protein
MKLLTKYALFAALLGAAVVEAQTGSAPRALPAAEMRARAEQVKSEIEEDHRHVLHLQAVVRKEKDVIKLTCVNDKLVQIKAQMNLYDNANLQLDGALASEGDAQAPFSEVEKAGADVKRLRSEADGCAGELDMFKQESRADVERPELDDPTAGEPFHSGEQTGDPDIEVPGYATPFR